MKQIETKKKPVTLEKIHTLTDEDLFTPEILTKALELLTTEAGSLVADVNTPEGRKEINKTSRAIGGAMKRLDDRRRAYVAELKAKPKAIDDLFRENFREPAEAMKNKVRAPLDEWTENQRAADEETMRLLGIINEPIEVGTSAAELEVHLGELKCMDLPDWLNSDQREALTNALRDAIPRIEAAHAAALYAEKQAAELEQLRREAAERAQKEHEAQIAKEAADRARKQAEAKAREEAERAERERVAAEQAQAAEQRRLQQEAEQERLQEEARIANREHQAQVHRSILDDLMHVTGLPETSAKAVVTAIARQQIEHLEIKY